MKRIWIAGGLVGVVLVSLMLAGGPSAIAQQQGLSLEEAAKATGYKFTWIDKNTLSFQFEGEFGATWKIAAATQDDYEYVLVWTTIADLTGLPSRDVAIRCLELSNKYGASFIAYDRENNQLDCQMGVYKPTLSGEVLKDALRQVLTMADDEYRDLRKMLGP